MFFGPICSLKEVHCIPEGLLWDRFFRGRGFYSRMFLFVSRISLSWGWGLIASYLLHVLEPVQVLLFSTAVFTVWSRSFCLPLLFFFLSLLRIFSTSHSLHGSQNSWLWWNRTHFPNFIWFQNIFLSQFNASFDILHCYTTPKGWCWEHWNFHCYFQENISDDLGMKFESFFFC